MRATISGLLLAVGVLGCQASPADRPQPQAVAAMMVDPKQQAEAIAAKGLTDLATGANLSTIAQKPGGRPVPKELEKKEVTISWTDTKDLKSRTELVQLFSDSRFFFWSRVDHPDGRVTYTFARLKEPGLDSRDLGPKAGDRSP